jgi:hypothetical protein
MKNSEVTEEIQGNNFPFGLNYEIKTDFELRIREETGF